MKRPRDYKGERNKEVLTMPDPCQPLRDELQQLQDELTDLERIPTAGMTGEERGNLNTQIQFVRDQIADKQTELRACQSGRPPVSPIPGGRVFGQEISQGLRGYSLVAGKDTLVRVFVGSVSSGQATVLDYASLRVQRPQGADFSADAVMSSGVFTNTSQSYSELDNVNFYVSGGELQRVGRYTFNASFYQNGQLVGTLNVGAADFGTTKDLRVLVVVDNWPMTRVGWNAVQAALLRVNRNFPIRSGVGSLDGNLALGLRYAIDPVPFNYDADFPLWNSAVQRLQTFNNQQASAGRPDRADRILIVRNLQPGEPLLGGTAIFCGLVTGAVLNPGANYFATIICQEIGHTFCIPHSPNVTIGDPSAFDLLNRRSIPNAAPFMHNPVGPDDACLFEPQDWINSLNLIRNLNSTGPN
jgi:hypothetical protein